MAGDYLWYFNSLAGCDRSSSNVSETTNTSYFDATYVDRAISVSGSSANYIEIFNWTDQASVTELWDRFDFYVLSTTAATLPFCAYFNSSGLEIIRVSRLVNSENFTFAYWNGSTFVTAFTRALGSATLHNLTVRIIVHSGGSGRIELYVNNTLLDQATGLSITGTNIAKVRRYNIYAPTYYSQQLGKTTSTVGSQVNAKVPNANGAETDFAGFYTDLNETGVNDATVISSNVPDDISTFSHASITVPTQLVVGTVGVNARLMVVPDDVTEAQLVVRVGSTNYPSANVSPGPAMNARRAHWELNPADSAAWEEADLTAQFGVKAKA